MKNFSNSVKKILSIALAFIFICGVFGASASAGTYSTGTYVVAVANGVNVRSGAGTNYSIVGAATNGTSFYVSKLSGSWGYTSSIKCTNGTRSGWVMLGNCNYSPTYCTVKFNANGGTNAPATMTVQAGVTFTIPTKMPTRSGYSFLGWGNANSTTAKVSPGQSVHTNGSVTLYAVWLKMSPMTQYSTPLTDGFSYYISPACATNSVLDVQGWGTGNNTNIQIWKKGYTKNQRFQAKYYGSGYYYFVDMNSKRVLTVQNGIALNNENIAIKTKTLSDAQLFRLISAGNGYYYIQSKINPTYYVDINGASSSNGTNVALYQCNKTSAQKFKFTPVLDVNAAVNYAKTYTDNSGNLTSGKYNSATYNIYKPVNPPQYRGYDCANFVSQCLFAGVLNKTNNWAPVYRGQNYKNVQGGTTWISAPDLYRYLKNQGFSYAKVNSNLKNIYRGDVVFMDFDNDGSMDHATICTGFNSNGTPVYCAHSSWRRNYSYSTSQWSGGTAYVVHMSGVGVN